MSFYKILPASPSYKSNQALTYSSDAALEIGQLVTVSLKRQDVVGVVVGRDTKPGFKVKPISSVSNLPPLPQELLELSQWMAAYYVSGVGSVVRQMISPNYLQESKRAPKPVDSSASKSIAKLPPLTTEQKKVVAEIIGPGTYLVHGRTGSGKTRVYLELATKTLQNGKSVIVLTPEIGLTSQLEKQFKQALKQQVIVTHSSLTPAERRNIWRQILTTGEPLVIIGPRSALFSPRSDIGLIVIDECHDSSYKQNEAPHYHAGTVAAKLSQLYNCPLILGSATPAVGDYYLAEQKHRPILKMSKLATESSTDNTEIRLVDLKDQSHFKQASYLSDDLIKEVKQALEDGEQALLFLNRRGTARVVVCSDCGWTATCPHCGLPLTYHADSHNLRCHVCGYQQPAPNTCPACGGANISYKSVGSKAIEAEAQRLFPKAVIKRFDSDNLKAERLEQVYDEILAGKVDILVGTQTIAKGLDLPNLSVVGVIVADTNLYLPDYQADERTYQMIRQVIGRIGRGHRDGKAIIQTYSPDNPVLQAAITDDYASFYERELAGRRQYNYPPACHMLKLQIGRASAKSAELSADKLKHSLLAKGLKVTIEGPGPSFYEVRAGKHFFQLVIKSKSRSELIKALALVPSDWRTELDPQSLL